MLLPESVLLGLFPQGLILSKPASWEGADDGVFTVDVGFFLFFLFFRQLEVAGDLVSKRSWACSPAI